MQGVFTESYMPLGNIVIKQNFAGAKPTSYYRDLNIETPFILPDLQLEASLHSGIEIIEKQNFKYSNNRAYLNFGCPSDENRKN